MTHETRRTLFTFVLMVAVFGSIAAVVRTLRPHVALVSVPLEDTADEPAHPTTTPAADTATQPAAVSALQRTAHLRPPRVRSRRETGSGAAKPAAVELGQEAAAQPMIPLPVARAALDYVGDDPDAEEVWLAAINDPAMPAEARSDLIEDLNENGFPDPHNVTPDDLPLIVSRLALIEDLAPDAMDEVNEDAFAEAYKDLLNLYEKLTAVPVTEPGNPPDAPPGRGLPEGVDLPTPADAAGYAPADSL